MNEDLTRPDAPAPMLPIREYNFRHYRPRHFLRDVALTAGRAGPRPGDAAPDFTLPRADDGPLRLGDLRGRPVLLRFASFT